VSIVTHADDALHFEVSKRLAALGSSVTMTCSDEKSCLSLHDRVYRDPSDLMRIQILNPNDLLSVKSFVHQFRERFNRLDFILLNSNEMSSKESETTKQGYENSFWSTYMSNFLLIKLLEPILHGMFYERVY
jgi:retinol dehydrogenase 12